MSETVHAASGWCVGVRGRMCDRQVVPETECTASRWCQKPSEWQAGGGGDWLCGRWVVPETGCATSGRCRRPDAGARDRVCGKQVVPETERVASGRCQRPVSVSETECTAGKAVSEAGRVPETKYEAGRRCQRQCGCGQVMPETECQCQRPSVWQAGGVRGRALVPETECAVSG
jgi:hypothetical protein